MGLFCVVEGIDGSGKSHLTRALRQHIEESGPAKIAVMLKDDPTVLPSSWSNDRLKTMHRLTWSYDNDEPVWEYSRQYWLFSLLAWYALFYEQYVATHLAAGLTVVTDGWYFKHYARFRLSGDEGFNTLADYTLRALPQPDFVIFLDTPIAEVVRRKKGKSKPSEHGAFDAGEHTSHVESFAAYQKRSYEALRQVLDEHFGVVHTVTDSITPAELMASLTTWQRELL